MNKLATCCDPFREWQGRKAGDQAPSQHWDPEFTQTPYPALLGSPGRDLIGMLSPEREDPHHLPVMLKVTSNPKGDFVLLLLGFA